MQNAGSADRPALWLRQPHLLPLTGLVLFPCLASIFLILGVVQADPADVYSFLATGAKSGMFNAAPTWLDPTIGLITEAQGHLAALDWLHGIIPWWDPYTGIGMPLAAEMQTLAFFPPFVFLLALPHGWLALRLSIQILSGITLYALLIDMGTTRLAAFVAGALYGLSGTFFMVPHGATPLPFIPLLLLGLDRAARAAQANAPRGWGWIAIATSLLVYSGYPEVAFFGGLLAVVWSIARFATIGAARWRFTGKLALGGALGLTTTLPLLVPFLHYLSHAFVGPHTYEFAMIDMPRQGDALELLPFLYGPIGPPTPADLPAAFSAQIGPAWGQVGTWFGPVAVIGALALLVRPGRHRVIAFSLAGFILLWSARLLGLPGVRELVNLIPEVARADTIRFVTPAMDLALLILTGLAIDQWQRHGRLTRRLSSLAGAILLALLAGAVASNLTLLRVWYHAAPALRDFASLACAIDLLCAAGVLLMLTRRPSPKTLTLLAVFAVADAVLGFGSGQLSARRDARLDLGGVHWLQRHQGLSRLFTILPFGPNYPAAYGVAAINASQLPIDAAWMRYMRHQLDQDRPFATFDLAGRSVRDHRRAFEAIGVRDILALAGTDPFRSHPPDLIAHADQGIALAGTTRLRGTVPPARVPPAPIRAVAVQIGTYDGASTGPLTITLCSGTICAHGQAELAGAPDDQFLRIPLDHPLSASPHRPLTYVLRHSNGAAVVIWSGPGATGVLADLRLLTQPTHAASRVFSDRVMTIYQLPHPAPIFAAPGCRVTPAGWNKVTADCANPTRLIRRVAWFAGWHAILDHRTVKIARAGPLFQSIALPQGRSTVRFFYRPRDTRVSVALAVLALLVSLVLYRPEFMRGGTRTEPAPFDPAATRH
ncbi:hypothetical protein [Acidiphilium sp.]|uniref:hypothetical protein n=1 Tax=Acidiphilium sp. TaxID=527 RepID=UPI003CFD9904